MSAEPQERPFSPFAHHVGCELIEAAGGESRVRLPYKAELGNIYGVVHGGAIATLADFALGWAIRSTLPPGTRLATVELKINYIRAGQGDLEARARVVHRGRSLAVLEADVTDSSGALVARVLSTFAVRSARREKAHES